MTNSDLATVLCAVFMLGFGVGYFSTGARFPDEHPDEPRRVERLWTTHEHMHEQHAVVSQWRIWTERAAARGECLGHVLPGEDP